MQIFLMPQWSPLFVVVAHQVVEEKLKEQLTTRLLPEKKKETRDLSTHVHH